MKYSKVEMFGKIKEMLASAGANKDFLDFCDKEIENVKNKYAGAKLKKDTKAKAEYEALKPKFLEFFKNKEIVGNADIALEGISTSKKTAIFGRLMDEGLVEKCEKEKAKDRVTYRLKTE